MKRKTKYIIGAAMIVVLVAVLLVALFVFREDKETPYTVSAQQWEKALGDETHIQTICRNVTLDLHIAASDKQILLATANGELMIDDGEYKHICVSSENGFTTYIYSYKTQQWDQHNVKDAYVDEALNIHLPLYTEMAMAGLQGEFANATYNAKQNCYIISCPTDSAGEGGTMHCRVYFESGKLVRLETEIVSKDTTLTLKLYDIGKTKVEDPAEYQNS